MFNSRFNESIAEVINSESIVTNRMMDAIDTWLCMFSGEAPWLKNGEVPFGVPQIVAGEIARSVTLEMEVTISGSPMGDFIQEQFKEVLEHIRPNTEYACAGGGIVFKPYVSGEKICTEIIHANSFFPISFNSAQKITGAYFIYRTWKGKKVYSRLEKHELLGTEYVITNKAYVSLVDEALGKECSLLEVEEWAGIEPEVRLQNIESPLFSYFKIPVGNTVDIRSPLGVSVYSRAEGAIKEVDKQLNRLLWEYEGGELAIDASEDAFLRVNGKPKLPEGKERLFRTNNLDAATVKSGDSLLKAWSPAIRDENFLRGLNRLLMQIEDLCCISRGVLSDPTDIARSATEMKIMKQRSYALVSDIQKSLQSALEDLAYAIYCLAVLYELVPDGEYTSQFIWDDSIIIDDELERARDMQEVREGLMLDYEYRMKWYGEDEATAKAKLQKNKQMSDDELLGFGNEEEVDETETETEE